MVVLVGATVVVVVVDVGAAVVVVVVVGAAVVVVVGVAVVVVVAPGPTTVPEQLPGGMQRELPLLKAQQTQPGLQMPGLLAQTTLPQVACVTWAPAALRTPIAPSSAAAAALTAARRETPAASFRDMSSNRFPSILAPFVPEGARHGPRGTMTWYPHTPRGQRAVLLGPLSVSSVDMTIMAGRVGRNPGHHSNFVQGLLIPLH